MTVNPHKFKLGTQAFRQASSQGPDGDLSGTDGKSSLPKDIPNKPMIVQRPKAKHAEDEGQAQQQNRSQSGVE